MDKLLMGDLLANPMGFSRSYTPRHHDNHFAPSLLW